MRWHRGEFIIALHFGGHPVQGLVSADRLWGIYRPGAWKLSHLPSGQGVAFVTTLRQAKQLAEELSAVPVAWSSAKPFEGTGWGDGSPRIQALCIVLDARGA